MKYILFTHLLQFKYEWLSHGGLVITVIKMKQINKFSNILLLLTQNLHFFREQLRAKLTSLMEKCL